MRCPQCDKRLGMRLRAGEAVGYCRNCKIEIEAIIRVIEEDPKANVRGG